GVRHPTGFFGKRLDEDLAHIAWHRRIQHPSPVLRKTSVIFAMTFGKRDRFTARPWYQQNVATLAGSSGEPMAVARQSGQPKRGEPGTLEHYGFSSDHVGGPFDDEQLTILPQRSVEDALAIWRPQRSGIGSRLEREPRVDAPTNIGEPDV